MGSKTCILDLDREELAAVVKGRRADQLWRSLHRDAATSFPDDLREQLEERFFIDPLEKVFHKASKDRSTDKALFRLTDGELIETVLMRYEPDGHRKARRTVCISTQAGCALGCIFCATGQQGFRRNLTVGEIVGQVLWMSRLETITNVVFMGMGEPFANYDRTLAAIRILTDGRGLKIGPRHITVSTVGLVPQILQFAKEKVQVNLAVSLHAADDATRSETVPINRRHPLRELMAACRTYIKATKRRVFFEYVLLSGQNDRPDDARKLGALLGGMDCHVNLIPVNPTGEGPYGRPTDSRSDGFQAILQSFGVPSTIRVEKGIDISAGCGQLRARAIAEGDESG